MSSNKIKKELLSLGLIEENNIREFFPSVRDRDDVRVMIDNSSGLIFLSETEHIEKSYYQEKPGTSYWSSVNREEGLKITEEDDRRRYDQFGDGVKGKKFLDVGCGLGGSLELFGKSAEQVYGVEVQNDIRKILLEKGFKAFDSVFSIPEQLRLDVISLFHVFEHLPEPLSILQRLTQHLEPGGKIIIEVPHANDALIKTYSLDSFKKFTFWSEHLILHTRNSLYRYMETVGLKNIKINGFQRYPLSNHLYWLNCGKPGGQNIWKEMRNEKLERAYAEHLNELDRTDTLIAIAEK